MDNNRKKLKICALSIALMTLILFSGFASVAASDSWVTNRPTQTTSYNSQTLSNLKQDGKGDVSVLAQITNYSHNDAAYQGNDVLRLNLVAAGNGREALQYVIEKPAPLVIGGKTYGYAPIVYDTFGYPMWLVTSTPTGITGVNSGAWLNLSQGFWFYGIQYWRVWVSSNGFISFTDNSTSPVPKPLNSTAKPNTLIAAFWTALNVGTTGAITYYMDDQLNVSWNHWVFCVTWKVQDNAVNNAWQVFQIILQQNTGSANDRYMDDIYINYQSIEVHSGVTIGVENQVGTKATSWNVNGITPESYLEITCAERARNLVSMSVQLQKDPSDTYSAFNVPMTPDGHKAIISQNLNGLNPHIDYNWGAAMFAFTISQFGDFLIGECIGALADAVTTRIGYMDTYTAYSDAQFISGYAPVGLPQVPSIAEFIPWDAFYYTDPGGLSGFGDYNSNTASMTSTWELTDYACRYDSMISAAIDWVLYDANNMPHSVNIVVTLNYAEPNPNGLGTTTQTISTSVHLTLNNIYQPDSTSPYFTYTPGSPTIFERGSTGSLTWTLLDDDPGTYTISQNGTIVYGPNSWADNPTIQYRLPATVLGTTGTYIYSCTARDKSGHYASNVVTVYVQNGTLSIDSPLDVSYAYGTLGRTITWHPWSNFPMKYQVLDSDLQGVKDPPVLYQGTWNGSAITVNLGVLSLSVGTHTFECIIWDAAYNHASDQVNVTVTPPPPPIIDSPADVSYYSGIPGNWITWNPKSDYPLKYQVLTFDYYGNPQVWMQMQGTWDGTAIKVNVDGLLVGTHTFECDVWDIFYNHASDQVTVTVIPSPPTINSPLDISYTFGTTGHTISWNPSSSYPSHYEIRRNGVLIKNATWDGSQITQNVDGLQVGTYGYAISVYDTSGQSVYDVVSVTVTPPPPTVTCNPSSVTYNYGLAHYYVTFTVTGAGPGPYTISGPSSTSGTWSSGQQISFDVGGLGYISEGQRGTVTRTYIFVFTATDSLGQRTSYTLYVYVICPPYQ